MMLKSNGYFWLVYANTVQEDNEITINTRAYTEHILREWGVWNYMCNTQTVLVFSSSFWGVRGNFDFLWGFVCDVSDCQKSPSAWILDSFEKFCIEGHFGHWLRASGRNFKMIPFVVVIYLGYANECTWRRGSRISVLSPILIEVYHFCVRKEISRKHDWGRPLHLLTALNWCKTNSYPYAN